MDNNEERSTKTYQHEMYDSGIHTDIEVLVFVLL